MNKETILYTCGGCDKRSDDNKYKIRKNEKLVRNNIDFYVNFWDSWLDKFLDSKTEGMVMGVLVCRDCGWFAGKQHLKNPSDFPYKFKNR